MFAFFDSVISFFEMIITFITSLVSGIAMVVQYMVQGVAYLSVCLLHMPSIVAGVLGALIGLSVVFLIVDR